ncbi:CaiB/BaiF CoA transferase family protein [Microlunatus soli]|uniref:Crotonobetainyl-CoA:carnitine CoA-transferase CaiB n=1 Tax=Microlunatus soli TaxID=630515 RepID=A0A1H1PD16_9ACTN|nr:CoA transferase [Microlunatus soli]SDS09017.1 Crotonobetainyl-CoA:carnitine CoA-transferase CaiB [Microlunatus soli]
MNPPVDPTTTLGPARDRPLHGVRVLDLSRLVAGNQLTLLLGDFGADVIKVEQPGVGDSLRRWRTDGQDAHWQVYGRNKRSITLDLKSDGGRDLLLRLAEGAQLVVESFRPGTLERLGIDGPTLRDRNPALVLVRISGWGQTGAYADRPGFGTLVEAMSGLAAMNGFPDREPVLPPGALADMIAGSYGAFAAVMAIRTAETTGEGQDIDLSLFEPLFSVLGPQAAMYKITGQPPQRSGSRSRTSAPRNVYRCADGRWLALSGSTQPMTETLFRAIGRPELITDPRFVDNSARLQNVTELDKILDDYFGARDLADIVDLMRAAGVTAAPVSDIADLVDSEYVTSRQVIVDGPAPTDDSDDHDHDRDTVPMHNVVPRLTRTPGAIARPAPHLGEHNDEILGPLLSGTHRHDATIEE